MDRTRRAAIVALVASPLVRSQQQQNPQNPNREPPIAPPPDEDRKLPNGKSQNDAIAKQAHEEALKDTKELIDVAEQLRDELQRAGSYVVPVSSLKKTEEIEKLARRIRGRLKE